MQQQDFPQHSSTLRPSARHSVNSPFVHRTFRQLPSTFCLSVENILCGSWTFRLTSDNFQCGRGSFRQVFVHHQDLQSSSVNIPCSRRLPSTCINFSRGCGTYRQLSVHPRDLSPTPCVRGTIHELSVRQGRFHQLLSTFHASEGLSVKICVSAEHCVIFSKHSVRPWGFHQLPPTFSHSRHLPLTFRATVGASVTFRQLSVRSWIWHLSSTLHAAVDITSTFLAPAQPSIKFHLLSIRPRDLP